MIPFAGRAHLFLLGEDYHLGDLLWLTAVFSEYRQEYGHISLLVGCPDRAISRILEGSPLVDCLLYGTPDQLLAEARRRFGRDLIVRDLRPFSLACAMLRDWRRRLPWLYFRDLWWRARGEWLARFLGLERPRSFRPVIGLQDADRATAGTLPTPYILLAPRIGRYRFPFATSLWRTLKGRPEESWITLARWLRRDGYEPITLAAAEQEPIDGTRPLLGLPIRQVAGVIEGAAALVTVESGLWYLAAASETPFIIARWWLPRSVNWPAAMNVQHRLVYPGEPAPVAVYARFQELMRDVAR